MRNAQDLFHFLIALVFKVKHGQGLFHFAEFVDSGIQQLNLFFLFGGILDIVQFGGQSPGVDAGDQPALFAKAGDSGVESDPVEPGTDPGFAAKPGVGPPKLEDNLLEKVLPVGCGKTIQPAYFIKHAPVFAHQPYKGFLYGGVLQIDSFEAYSLCRG